MEEDVGRVPFRIKLAQGNILAMFMGPSDKCDVAHRVLCTSALQSPTTGCSDTGEGRRSSSFSDPLFAWM